MNLSPRACSYIFIILVYAMASCTPHKKLPKVVKSLTRQEILNVVLTHNVNAKWFSAKGDIDLATTDQEISGTFDLRMRTDSVMIVSARKLGIEGARLQITPTDYTILYRMEAMYQREPLTALRRFTGFDIGFDDIEAMALGNIILPDTSMSIIEDSPEGYKVSNVSKELSTTYWVDKVDQYVSRVVYNDKSNQQISITLSEYKPINGVNIPHLRFIQATTSQGISTITINIETAEIDIPKKINFNIPDHYEKI